MYPYIIRRLLLFLPSVFLTTILIFLLVRFLPGDVIDMMQAQMVGEGAIDRQAIERALGLDVPIYTQYGRWLGIIPSPDKGYSGLVQGDLGTSLRGGFSVSHEILSRIPITFELALLALIVSVITSIPMGVYSAIRQDTVGDYVVRSISIFGISVPSFWIGTIVMIYPAVLWGWSPYMQFIPFFENPIGNLQMFIIPAIVMGLGMAGISMRMTRTMMLETLRQDYIRAAWAKGVSERTVILRHALKNALLPIVTILGTQISTLVAGSVVTESIFNLPGLGRLMLDSLRQRDYPMISGVNLFVAFFVLSINLIVDLTYAWLDPKLRQR
jgi:peptide/nickel transport system permease protein